MRIDRRATWGPTVATDEPMPGVPEEVWIHWPVHRPTADPYADMRSIERTGIARFGIFSYSYCYHPPTRLWLEGAGHTIGAHTKDHNTRGLGLAVIAAPGYTNMPHVAEDTAALIRHFIATGRLAPGAYPTGGHRDLKATECPGDQLYALIPTIRRLVAGDVQEDEMTPEQAKMLREVHEQLCTSRDPSAPGGATVRWMGAKLLERTADLVTGRRPGRG